jgi:hypothetical protein
VHDRPLQEPDAPVVSVLQTLGSSSAFEEASEYGEGTRGGGVLDGGVPTSKRAKPVTAAG